MLFSGRWAGYKFQQITTTFVVSLFSLMACLPSYAAGGAAHAALPSTQILAKTWNELSPTQKTSLAPLAIEWNSLSEAQRIKWMEIAQKFPSMKPDEQKRIQERMHAWVSLTPQQRMAARENFALTTKLTPEAKSAKWQAYQQLSDDEKKRLAELASKKTRVANLPAPAQREVAPLKPLKIGPKPKLVKPAAAPIAAPATLDAPATTPSAPSPASSN